MQAIELRVAAHTAAAATTSFIASAGFAAWAVQDHMRIIAFGRICGVLSPTTFFMHCPACPTALGFALLGITFTLIAVRQSGATSMRLAGSPSRD